MVTAVAPIHPWVAEGTTRLRFGINTAAAARLGGDPRLRPDRRGARLRRAHAARPPGGLAQRHLDDPRGARRSHPHHPPRHARQLRPVLEPGRPRPPRRRRGPHLRRAARARAGQRRHAARVPADGAGLPAGARAAGGAGGGAADHRAAAARRAGDLSGRAFPRRGARMLRTPAVQQPHVPIIVAGGGERTTLRFVAQYADASNLGAASWAGGAFTPEDVRRKFDVLRAHCAEAGRPYEAVLRTAQVRLFLAESRERGRRRWRPGAVTAARLLRATRRRRHAGGGGAARAGAGGGGLPVLPLRDRALGPGDAATDGGAGDPGGGGRRVAEQSRDGVPPLGRSGCPPCRRPRSEPAPPAVQVAEHVVAQSRMGEAG